MNAFFERFGGPIALLISLVFTFIVSHRWSLYRNRYARRNLIPFLYWGPIFLISCMILHLLQNAYRAVISFQQTGAFNFYYYSLQLFGIVVAYQSFLLLVNCHRFVAEPKRKYFSLLSSMGWIVLTTLPTFAFTPIGIIPTVILLVTLFVSAGIHPSTKKAPSTQFKTEAFRTLEAVE